MILLDLIVNTPGEDEAFSELSVDDDRIPNWAVGEDSILGHRPMWNDEYPTIWDELGITDNMLLNRIYRCRFFGVGTLLLFREEIQEASPLRYIGCHPAADGGNLVESP